MRQQIKNGEVVMNKKIFGYKYDDKSGGLVIDEKEAKAVRAIFDLYGNYKLYKNEIAYLFNRETTIENIIVNRIDNLVQTLSKYDIDIKIDIDNGKLIRENKEFQNNIINLLVNSKKLIEIIDSSMNEVLLGDVDDIVLLITKQEEIYDKYGDFKSFDLSNYKEDIDDLTY